MAKRFKATILYATETGKSETYAKILQGIFNHAFNAKVSFKWGSFETLSKIMNNPKL